jgi:hypothetical protein
MRAARWHFVVEPGLGIRMSRDDPAQPGAVGPPKLFCDLTQSWSDVGGGVRTLLHKRSHILDRPRTGI